MHEELKKTARQGSQKEKRNEKLDNDRSVSPVSVTNIRNKY